ncbi:translation initiation factor IF-2-like [Meles meles]|uniref:translation initiation factor IF-2-like n=1 Tax=Meles meles TaxID=9662 RepID=UPI001E69B7EF|nr:translation initiation factor IF-2-like [Meles meles]
MCVQQVHQRNSERIRLPHWPQESVWVACPPPLHGARAPKPRPTWATRRHREARSKSVRPAPPPQAAAAQRSPQGGRERNRWGPNAARVGSERPAATVPGEPSPTPSGSEQGLPAGANGRGRGGEASSSVPAGRGRKDTAQGGGRGRGGRRKAPGLATRSTGFRLADPGGLEQPHRGPGDPPTRGAAGVPGITGQPPWAPGGPPRHGGCAPGLGARAGEEPRARFPGRAESRTPGATRPPHPRLSGPVAPAAPAPHLPSQLRRTPQASHPAPTGRTPPRRL